MGGQDRRQRRPLSKAETHDHASDALAKILALNPLGFWNAMCPYIFSEGSTVSCSYCRYVFEIENRGGIWSSARNNETSAVEQCEQQKISTRDHR